MKKYLGNVAIIITLLITILIWLPLKNLQSFSEIFNQQYLGQITGLLGVILIAWDFILAMRLRILEKVFGGLDKLYRIHHLVGGLGFILVLNHPIFLALSRIALPQSALSLFILGSNWSYNWGILSLYAFIIIIFITLYTKLPYQIWRNIHALIGIPLIIAILHVFFISSDVSRDFTLRIWILVWLGLALLAFLYKKFLYKYLAASRRYRLKAINQIGLVAEIILEPLDQKLDFRPGQFIFAEFLTGDLKGESHPFSLASDPGRNEIRLGIKALGDFTLKLLNLKPGVAVRLYGPFGSFFDASFIKKDYQEVWIAGGIGITPFLSMLETRADQASTRVFSLYYGARTVQDAAFHNYILEYQKVLPNFKYNFSTEIIQIKEILAQLGENAFRTLFYLCGPPPMMLAMAATLKQSGIKNPQIIFEEFNFKS
ncbi:MAG: ferric reductase-like transmembrane domain-containing protein [bacterium]